jgi:hypothetical protein
VAVAERENVFTSDDTVIIDPAAESAVPLSHWWAPLLNDPVTANTDPEADLTVLLVCT